MTLKLSIDLIPETAFFKNVRSHVKKSEWKKIREIVINTVGESCQACGTETSPDPLEVHEVFRYGVADNVPTQTLERFLLLCRQCHQCIHFGLWQSKGHGERLIRHLMEVNGLPRDAVLQHIDDSFLEWQIRSQFRWTINLELLNQYGITIDKS